MRPAFYQPSGHVPAMTVMLLLVSFVCALLGAFAYAAITVRTGWFVNLVLAWGLGWWLALAVTMACTLTKVRDPGLMGQFGLVVGLFGWFAQWVFWIVFACYDDVRSMPGQSFRLVVTDLLAGPGGRWPRVSAWLLARPNGMTLSCQALGGGWSG